MASEGNIVDIEDVGVEQAPTFESVEVERDPASASESVHVMEGKGEDHKPISASESAEESETEGGYDGPIVATFQDHFTLPAASNLIRFRNKHNAARVYESKGVQLVVEETYDEKNKTRDITVRRLHSETISVQFLRALYSIVCALWTGFLFVFCLQFQLFLILELGIESGATHLNASVNYGAVIGVALALVVFDKAFSEAMVIAGHYIVDMWSGHFLAKQFIFRNLSDVATEWIFCAVFLLIPLFVMSITLLQQRDDWWAITAIVWFGCVMGFYALFCFNIVYYEVKAAFDFARNMRDDDSDEFWDVVKRCIGLRQLHRYGGKVKRTYLADGAFESTEDTEAVDKCNVYEGTGSQSLGLYTKLIERMPESLFTKLATPQRLYTIEDVQDYRPFLSYSTWSLESIFCRPKNSRYIAIIKGPGRLTQSQMRSSMLCSVIGAFLIILIVVGFLVWFDIPGSFIAIAFFCCLVLMWSSLKNAIDIFKVGKDVLLEIGASKEKTGYSDASEGLYIVQESKRVAVPTELAKKGLFVLDTLIWFVYPAVTLFTINVNTALFFVFISAVSGVRYYINVEVVIEETGNLNLVGGDTEQQIWDNKARLSDIVDYITSGKSRRLWAGILGFGGLVFLAIFLGAVGKSTDSQVDQTLGFLPNFTYPALSDDVRYPTCSLGNPYLEFGEDATMADYAFLAGTAYLPEDLTQISFDNWFGEGVAEDRQDIVDDFRSREDPDNTPVVFKLVSFPAQRIAIILIRGTTTNWDMLADTQLWSAASLMQGLRAILPAGEIWTPILDQLVNWINTLQAESVEKVSFYRLTTKFAEELKENPNFDHIHVTGHSLGGGLSMITGAQAGVPAVGLSGPNALISGKSLDPPVTPEEMNKYTFNIIPNRDLVPMLDDAADQIQQIQCTSPANDFVSCHFAKRSLCEILYTCGSEPRPVLCECVRDYGYPKPDAMGDIDFDEACGIE